MDDIENKQPPSATTVGDELIAQVLGVVQQCVEFEEALARRSLTWTELNSLGLVDKVRALLRG